MLSFRHMYLSTSIAGGNQQFDQLLQPTAAPSNLAARQRLTFFSISGWRFRLLLSFYCCLPTTAYSHTYLCLPLFLVGFAFIWRVYPHWALSIPIQIEFSVRRCRARSTLSSTPLYRVELHRSSEVLLVRVVVKVDIFHRRSTNLLLCCAVRATSALLRLAGCFVGRTHSCLDRCRSKITVLFIFCFSGFSVNCRLYRNSIARRC